MKWRNSFAVVVGSLAACLITTNSQAQSAFAGFYGQLSTGYESNQLGSQSDTARVTPYANSDTNNTGPSQTFGGAPLVLGIGYYWKATDKWLIGLGADYSALTQTSSEIPKTVNNAPGSTSVASGSNVTFNGSSMQLSNRFNLFITPGYAIDKDKLVYMKAGYSQVTAQYNVSTSLTRTANGVSTKTAATGGSQSSNQGGFLLGLGYKQMFASGLYGFVEGNYMGYSAPSYTFTSTTGQATNPTGTRTVTASFASLNTFQALIGLGYAF
jgi:outer membrane immunogenic protein